MHNTTTQRVMQARAVFIDLMSPEYACEMLDEVFNIALESEHIDVTANHFFTIRKIKDLIKANRVEPGEERPQLSD